jgi:chaperonin GroES
VVVAAGPGRLHPHTGVRIPNPVQLGDSVLYGKFDGSPIEYKDDQCQVIRDDNIMVSYQGVSMTLENCQPTRDFVLIQLEEQALETKSGIVVAAQVVKEDVICEGRILKVGEGRMASDGLLTKVPFKVGDFVKFKDYGGNDVVIEGKPFSLVRMVDILATLKEQE